jgi:hypothetical protein
LRTDALTPCAQEEQRRRRLQEKQAYFEATPQPARTDTFGVGTVTQASARLATERALLAENLRLAAERQAALQAALQAERAEERANSNLEWWDRASGRRTTR